MFNRKKSDLKSIVIDESISLATGLRQVKVLAFALGQDALKSWLDAELKGYSEGMDLPDYRKLAVESLGTFAGPFGSSVDHQMLPLSLLPEWIGKRYGQLRIADGIREIEELAQQDASKLRMRWPAEVVMIARDYLEMSNGFVLVDAWQPMPAAAFQGILDAVRNRLLDFLLELEQLDPEILSSRDAASRAPSDRVEQIINYTISGSQNVIASGKDFTQQSSQPVLRGDLESLMSFLGSMGIQSPELEELKKALTEDRQSPSKSGELGPRVQSWLGRMTAKAAEGAWKTATTAAPQLVVKALSQYLGLS